jgi:zinc transport system permease protein
MDDFVIRALLGGIGVAVVAGPLGSFVVWARMAFFGAAIAHAALLGVALGLLLGVSPALGVVAVAALVAVALAGLQAQRTVATDTLLAILAHGTLAVGLVAIAFMETVRVDLMGTLFGDILALGRGDLYAIWGAALAALAVLGWIWRPLLSLMVHEELARVEGVAATRVRLTFMLLIALVVALSIKVVGGGGGADLCADAGADGASGERDRVPVRGLGDRRIVRLGHAVRAVDRRRRGGGLRGLTAVAAAQALAAALRRRNPLSRSAMRSAASSSPAWMRSTGPGSGHGRAVRVMWGLTSRIRLS